MDEDDVVVAETTTFYEAIAFTVWHTWVSRVNQLSLSDPCRLLLARVRQDKFGGSSW